LVVGSIPTRGANFLQVASTPHGHPTAEIIRRVAGVTLLIAAVAAVAMSDTLHNGTLRLVAQVAAAFDTHPILGAFLFVLFSAVSAMLAFVSAAVIVPVAVQALGQPATVMLLWAGWMLGGLCAYGVGRFLGRAVVSALAGRNALARFERLLHANTPFPVILLFQLALPSELPGYLLGMLRYPLPKYLLALAMVELPYAAATTYLGASFLRGNVPVIVGIGVLGIALSIWALKLLRRALPGMTHRQP
jgi:uncharacterized membrane protein YdjX (TVP38/TMEM64 family)